jgi:hypothetical protein
VSDLEHENDVPLEELDAEPELDDDAEAEADPEPEPEPEEADEPEPEAPSDEDRARMFAKIDGSFKTYQRNVEKQLGDDVTEWLFCPLCASGAVVGYVNRNDLGRIPDEVEANVNTFMGYARETDYPEARGINQCACCAGLGKVSTGSRVAEHMTITCPECKGYGYTPPGGGHPLNGNPATGAASAASDALADLGQPERDAWGEPKVLPDGTLNGNYGKMPQFKSVHPEFGITANLSPEELISG